MAERSRNSLLQPEQQEESDTKNYKAWRRDYKTKPRTNNIQKTAHNYVQVLPDETYNITDKTDYLDKFLDNYNFEDENEKRFKVLHTSAILGLSPISD